MRRRDAAAAQLHGRFITKVFKDPVSKQPRSFWGKLYYRGNEHRPHYFHVVYEDGDEQHMTAAQARKHLQPAGVQLPAGANIPEPAALAAMQHRLLSCLASAAGIPIAAADVPAAAVELLVEFMQDSLSTKLVDPCTSDQSLAAALQQHGHQLHLTAATSSTDGVIVAPTAATLTTCLSALRHVKAAWLACYLPSGLSSEQQYLAQLLSAQRGSTLLRCGRHSWLVIG
eukprot:GHUV01018652.1.p1 GENE.GHUV01018652.1~~GHUV01018652.1.p1  ORF type:complete len:228 (-),score=105.09 GHUV01018652.1:239-922(-)